MKPDKQSVRRDGRISDTAWMLVQQQQQHRQSQSQCSSRSSGDETPFSREGQVTHRTATPVQQQTDQSEDTDELRRYIKMVSSNLELIAEKL